MLGAAGLDETVGGTDDYTIKLVYAGLTTSCDIVAKSDTGTSFASCAFGGAFLPPDFAHVGITSGTFRYNPTAGPRAGIQAAKAAVTAAAST